MNKESIEETREKETQSVKEFLYTTYLKMKESGLDEEKAREQAVEEAYKISNETLDKTKAWTWLEEKIEEEKEKEQI